MNADIEAVLEVVGADLDAKAERVAGFLRDGGDPVDTYEALALALLLITPAEVLDLAFAGIVAAANVKLAADAAVNDSADV